MTCVSIRLPIWSQPRAAIRDDPLHRPAAICTRTVLLSSRSLVPVVGIVGGNPSMLAYNGEISGSFLSCRAA
jgi:hypothetical protein